MGWSCDCECGRTRGDSQGTFQIIAALRNASHMMRREPIHGVCHGFVSTSKPCCTHDMLKVFYVGDCEDLLVPSGLKSRVGGSYQVAHTSDHNHVKKSH